jgi:hypothetical protein
MTSQSQLSGPLLWIVVAASLAAIVGVAGFAFAFEDVAALGLRYEIAVGFATAWSLVFLIMTAMHAPATPVVASVGLIVWIAYRLAVAIVSGGWPLMLDLLLEAVMAAAFCGYMATGASPNAYYRRRLPAS